MPGIVGLTVLGGGASHIKSVRDFARLQKMQSDILIGEIKTANGIAMIKALQENMAGSKLFKKSPEIYQATVKGAVENTEFKEVRVDTELALQDEEGAMVFNQLVAEMGLEEEEVNAIIENKADLVVPTEIYAQTVMDNDAFNQYISFDEQGHSVARKKYYMAVAEDMAKSINLEQEEKQAELIDAIIRERFPEEGVEQDMGAACILMNPANPKEAWRQMMRDVTDSIDARLGGIVKNLEEGMSRGVHYYYSEESGYSVKRMSDNDAWYGDFYKQHKRKPNKAELLEMAREVYKGNGDKYGMPEHRFEATDEMQEDFDALDQDFANREVLENIKEKIDTLPASEMAIMRGLTPSGYKVYQQVRKQFESGNTDVQKAGRMNAILFARYAERMADNISKITGQEYTAEDYMRERIGIVPNASGVEDGVYGQGVPVESFYTVKVTENEFGNYKNLSDLRKKALEWYKNNLQGTVAHNHALGEIIIDKSMAEQDILFGGKGRRKMSSTSAKAEKMLLVKHLKDLTENANFITEAEASDNKHIGEHFYYLHGTILFGGEKQYVIVTVRKTQEKQLLYYNHNVYTPNEYKKIEGYLQETLGSRSSSPNQYSQEVPSVNNSIPDGAEVFNKQKIFYQVYNQTAYHGSPHTFDKFDLGAIGSGEGAQAHGWGLYFAKDRSVANNYRVALAGSSYTLNGKDLNDVYQELERKGEWDKLTVLEDFMVKQDIAEMDVDDYDSSAWKWFKQIHPKIKGKGSLTEVDIPENDVLLDEDKPLSEQPEKVRQAIFEFYRQRPDDFILPKSENDFGDGQSGGRFYEEVVFQMRREGHEDSPERAASELLNELGIKGITYDGMRDGRCYVVFDDKAIDIIERYNQSADMRKQSFATMKDFADAIEKDRGAVTKLGNWIQTNGGAEFVIAGSSYLHIQNGAHPLSIEQWQALVDNIDNCENAESITFFDNQKGSFGGIPVGVKIKTPLGKAGAILEFLPSGKVFLVTAVYNNDKALDNWIKNKKNSHTLEVGDIMSQNRIMGSSFIDIIQEKLGIVKNVHRQAAMRKENKAYVTNSQGNIDWGYINDAVADDGTEIKKAPVRMQIGFQVGKDKAGNGYTHMYNRHRDFIQAKGYKSIEEAVYDVLDSQDFVVQEETTTGTRLKLIKDLSPKTSIMLTLDWVTDENTGEVFYAPNSLLPRNKKQVEDEKRKALVFLGERSPQDQSPATGAFRASSGKNAGSVEGSFARKNTSAFDSISISEVEKYVKKFTYPDGVEQRSVASTVRGQTRISGMKRVVSLFESADKSTFVHEIGHVALADLKMLAEMEGAPAGLVRDWQTVKGWLGYKERQGFTREQHEKFARGFEAYLRTGEAPVRGLKAVFRTFKKWLCDIYADFVQLGGRPSPDVQAVMARMLASEEEIEAEARLQGIESITRKKGMKILDDTTQAMYERWVHEAKEEAKERVLKVAMQDIGDDYARQREAVISDMRKGIEKSLQEKDIFRAEECVRLSGGTDILPTLGYTEEQYRAELAV